MTYLNYALVLLFSIFAVAYTPTALHAQSSETAELQIIHNSADPAVAEVDIYVNGDLFLEGVPFRGATGFVELATDISYDIVVTPAGASPEEGFSFEGITLEPNERYYVVATGVADASAFAPNPDGIDTGFSSISLPERKPHPAVVMKFPSKPTTAQPMPRLLT